MSKLFAENFVWTEDRSVVYGGEMNGLVVEMKPNVAVEEIPALLERVKNSLLREFAKVRKNSVPNPLVRVEGAWRVVSDEVEFRVSFRRTRLLSGKHAESVVSSLELCLAKATSVRFARLSVNAIGRDDWWAGESEGRWGWVGDDVDVAENVAFAGKVKERLDRVSASTKATKRAEREAAAKEEVDRKRKLAEEQGEENGVGVEREREEKGEEDVAEQFGALRPVEEGERVVAERFLGEIVGVAGELGELGKRAQMALRGEMGQQQSEEELGHVLQDFGANDTAVQAELFAKIGSRIVVQLEATLKRVKAFVKGNN